MVCGEIARATDPGKGMNDREYAFGVWTRQREVLYSTLGTQYNLSELGNPSRTLI